MIADTNGRAEEIESPASLLQKRQPGSPSKKGEIAGEGGMRFHLQAIDYDGGPGGIRTPNQGIMSPLL